MSNVIKQYDPTNQGLTVRYDTFTEDVLIREVRPGAIEHSYISHDDRLDYGSICGRDRYDVHYENRRERVVIKGVNPSNIIRTRKDLMTFSKETVPLEKYRVIIRNTLLQAKDSVIFDGCESFSEDQAMFILGIIDAFTKTSHSMITGELIRSEIILGEGGGETNG